MFVIRPRLTLEQISVKPRLTKDILALSYQRNAFEIVEVDVLNITICITYLIKCYLLLLCLSTTSALMKSRSERLLS